MPGNNRKRPSSAASTSAKHRCVSEAESTCKPDAFAIGGIIALHQEGYSRQDILESMSVDKPDGSALADGNIGQVIRRWEADKSWRGERPSKPLVHTSCLPVTSHIVLHQLDPTC